MVTDGEARPSRGSDLLKVTWPYLQEQNGKGRGRAAALWSQEPGVAGKSLRGPAPRSSDLRS